MVILKQYLNEMMRKSFQHIFTLNTISIYISLKYYY